MGVHHASFRLQDGCWNCKYVVDYIGTTSEGGDTASEYFCNYYESAGDQPLNYDVLVPECGVCEDYRQR